MSTSKYQNFSCASVLGIPLGDKKINNKEADEESQNDTEISLEMRIAILEGGLHPSITRHVVFASNSTDHWTNKRGT